jgi:copper transport protein
VRRALLATVLPRFGRLALPAFVVVVATGLTNALIQLGHPEELWQTAYGRVLSVKIGLVGLIAAASYLHALRLRPRLVAVNPHPPSSLERRHWRALGAEPLLAVGVVAAVAVLVAFPLPPQQLGDAGEADAGEAEAAAPCEPCPLPRASDGELAVAEQVGSRIAAFWLRREGEELRGRVRVLDKSATPVDAPIELPGGEFTGCGTGCWRLRAPAGSELAVAVEEGGDTYTASVPAEWRAGRNRAAERLLALTQSRMRGLGSVRLNERITSGPGTFVRTRYRFQAPDRIAYSTSSGSRVIGIGKTRYHAEDGGWEQQPFGAGGFQFTQLFRWTAYGQAVRWLGTERDGGRALVALALFDPASPVWYRLMVDRGSGRVIGERMIAAAHFMDRRYFAFNQPLSIEAPG